MNATMAVTEEYESGFRQRSLKRKQNGTFKI